MQINFKWKRGGVHLFVCFFKYLVPSRYRFAFFKYIVGSADLS